MSGEDNNTSKNINISNTSDSSVGKYTSRPYDATRPRMTVGDRAKQFAPFAALTGLPKALSSMEKIVVPRPSLTEESLEELDHKMQGLKVGTIANLVYYTNGECIKISGMIAKIEHTSRIIQVVNKRISFDDILEISSDE